MGATTTDEQPTGMETRGRARAVATLDTAITTNTGKIDITRIRNRWNPRDRSTT